MSEFLSSDTDEHTFLHESIKLRNEIIKLTNEYHELVEKYLMKKLEDNDETTIS